MNPTYLKVYSLKTNGFPGKIPTNLVQLSSLAKRQGALVEHLRKCIHSFSKTHPENSIVDLVLRTDNNKSNATIQVYEVSPASNVYMNESKPEAIAFSLLTALISPYNKTVFYARNHWKRNYALNRKFMHEDFTDILLNNLNREKFLTQRLCFEGLTLSKKGNCSVIGKVYSPLVTNFEGLMNCQRFAPVVDTVHQLAKSESARLFNLCGDLEWYKNSKYENHDCQVFSNLVQAYGNVRRQPNTQIIHKRIADAFRLDSTMEIRRHLANAPYFKGTEMDLFSDDLDYGYYFRTKENKFTFVEQNCQRVTNLETVHLYSSFPKTLEQHRIHPDELADTMLLLEHILFKKHMNNGVEQYRMLDIIDEKYRKITCKTIVFAPVALGTTVFDMSTLPEKCRSIRFDRFNQHDYNLVNFAVETLEGFGMRQSSLRVNSGASGYLCYRKQIVPFEISDCEINPNLPSVITNIIQEYACEGKLLLTAYRQMKFILDMLNEPALDAPIAIYFEAATKNFMAYKTYEKSVPTNVVGVEEKMIFFTENLFSLKFAIAFEPLRRMLTTILPVIDTQLGGAVLMLDKRHATLCSRNVNGYRIRITEEMQINPDVIVHQSLITSKHDVRLKAIKVIDVNWREKQATMNWMPALKAPALYPLLRAITHAVSNAYPNKILSDNRYLTDIPAKESFRFVSDMLDPNYDDPDSDYSYDSDSEDENDSCILRASTFRASRPSAMQTAHYASIDHTQSVNTLQALEKTRSPADVFSDDLDKNKNTPYYKNEANDDDFPVLGPLCGDPVPEMSFPSADYSKTYWKNVNLYNYKGMHSFSS